MTKKSKGTPAFQAMLQPRDDREHFTKGMRAGRKVGFAEGIKGRLFRNVTEKRTDTFAKGFRSAYGSAFMAGAKKRPRRS